MAECHENCFKDNLVKSLDSFKNIIASHRAVLTFQSSHVDSDDSMLRKPSRRCWIPDAHYLENGLPTVENDRGKNKAKYVFSKHKYFTLCFHLQNWRLNKGHHVREARTLSITDCSSAIYKYLYYIIVTSLYHKNIIFINRNEISTFYRGSLKKVPVCALFR